MFCIIRGASSAHPRRDGAGEQGHGSAALEQEGRLTSSVYRMILSLSEVYSTATNIRSGRGRPDAKARVCVAG